MVPHLDTVYAIQNLERQHGLAEASRVHRLLATAHASPSVMRPPAGVRSPAMVLRGLIGMIRLRPAVATGLSS
jgi:phage tail tape-measure protein